MHILRTEVGKKEVLRTEVSGKQGGGYPTTGKKQEKGASYLLLALRAKHVLRTEVGTVNTISLCQGR